MRKQEIVIIEPTMEEKEMTVMDLPGVGPATAEKLSVSGFEDLMSIAVATPGELVDASGVGEAAAIVGDEQSYPEHPGDSPAARRPGLYGARALGAGVGDHRGQHDEPCRCEEANGPAG